MITTLISTMLICKSIQLVDFSKPPYTKEEKNVIKRARVVCEKRYKGCPVTIIKVKVRKYRVICGQGK